jgi:hypothetical protein
MNRFIILVKFKKSVPSDNNTKKDGEMLIYTLEVLSALHCTYIAKIPLNFLPWIRQCTRRLFAQKCLF